MQRNIGRAGTVTAAIAVFSILCGFPVAAENWVEAGKSKLGSQDLPYCIDVDATRKDADGWTSFIAAPCDPAWRKVLGDAIRRMAVRCDRPISSTAKYRELSKKEWSPERPMGNGVAVLAKFTCQRK